MRLPNKGLTELKKFFSLSISTLSLLLMASTLAAPASATEKGYRYWGYFQSPTGLKPWVTAMTGPTTIVPDGSVEGWVFTFSSDSIPDAAAPRALPNFGKLCATTKFNMVNQKRIGVIVDFGGLALRPTHEIPQKTIATCVVIDKDAIGFDVLAKVVKIRASASGFVCGLNGYPAKECGAEVDTPKTLIPKKPV